MPGPRFEMNSITRTSIVRSPVWRICQLRLKTWRVTSMEGWERRCQFIGCDCMSARISSLSSGGTNNSSSVCRLLFGAAHRLHSRKRQLTAEENTALYGKCNNARGHGHLYITEATVGGEFDGRSGTSDALFDELQAGNYFRVTALAEQTSRPGEMEEFRHRIFNRRKTSSSRSGRSSIPGSAAVSMRLRLWETANNRFTLRGT